ncbi:MAG: transglutaminase family protein [Alphaproteobacteria bacterium]
MTRIRVILNDPGPFGEALGLLAPIPPDTPHQRRVRIALSSGCEYTRITAANAPQSALWITAVADAAADAIFHFTPGAAEPVDTMFERLDNRFTRPPPALGAVIGALVEAARNDREKVRRIVDFTVERYRYGAGNPAGDEPALYCGVATGNCIDINTFLLSAFYAAGIPAAYCAGYFFEADRPPVADGMHCWITTLADGVVEDWDIAHHLKRGMRPVLPGLNPIPGSRYAMSVGRGLRFAIADTVVEIGHLAQPLWILSGGKTRIADITATRLP